MRIAVLDIQGSVIEHVRALEKAGAEVVRVKLPEHLEGVAGLVIPGGESTTIGMLMKRFGLDEAIKKKFREGMAIWGTCAGAILLAKRVLSEDVEGLELMDIVVERNAYGRQLDSFITDLKFAFGIVPAVFIRGPKIVAVGEEVTILARYLDEVVACSQGKLLATTFHPEMSDDLTVQRHFLEMCGHYSEE